MRERRAFLVLSSLFSILGLASLAGSANAAAPDLSSYQPMYSYIPAGTVSSSSTAFSSTVAVSAFPSCIIGGTSTSFCPAIVHVMQNGQWVEVARLYPGANETVPAVGASIVTALTDGFGSSVAISSDGNTIFVGNPQAPCSADPSLYCGAIDVYSKPTGGWADMKPTAQLTVSTSSGTTLGGRLLVSGNLLFAIGAESCGTVSGVCGTISVFTEPAAGWAAATLSATLVVPGYFGMNGGALAYDATNETLAVCLGYADAYLFQGSSGSFASGGPIATLSGGGALSEMGNSIAISNGVVAAGGPGSPGDSPGTVLLWVEPAGGWTDTSTLSAVLTPANKFDLTTGLGTGVLIDGSTIIASASSGPLYVFQEPAGGWVSENETSISGTPGFWIGGPLSWDGSSVAEQTGSCGNQEACLDGIVLPAVNPGIDGPALVLTADASPVLNPPAYSGSMPVVVAGKPAQVVFDITNIGNFSATGVQFNISPPADTSHYSTAAGNCTTQNSIVTCPASDIGPNSAGDGTITLTAPSKKTTFTITATAVDANQNWDSLDNTASLTAMSDNPPSVPANTDYSVDNGVEIQGNLNATDPDGDPVKFQLGSSVSGAKVTVSSTGKFTYTPSSSTFVGTDSFTYIASDGLLSTTGQVTIHLNPPSQQTGGSGGGGGGESLFGLALILMLQGSRKIRNHLCE